MGTQTRTALLCIVSIAIGCSGESECTAEVHCILRPDGSAECEDGYHFRGTPPDDYVCVPDTACGTCDPRPASCRDASTLVTYRSDGCAEDGSCRYTETEVACAMGCADGACAGCDNECSAVGEPSCEDGAITTCEADADGCLAFGAPTSCASGACESATSCGGCTHACELGETRCADGALSSCATGAGGCRAFDAGSACSSGRCDGPSACYEIPTAMNGQLCSIDGWCWASPLPSGNTLTAASAAGGQVFVVGTGDTRMRHDGSGWIVEVALDNAAWNDVFARTADDVWAVGDDGAIAHFDGSAWSRDVSGTRLDLLGVWASGPDDAWAVGVDVMLHYVSGTWTEVSSGIRPLTLNAVFGTGPNEIWAVGPGYGGSFLHYDGEDWSSSYSDGSSGSISVYSVWASGPSDYWAIGTGGVLLHYTSGPSWSETVRPELAAMRAIQGTSESNVWMVGEGAAYRFDGDSWDPAADPGDRALLDVTIDPSGAPWAVGSAGVVIRDEGTGWTSMAGLDEPPHDFYAVWPTPTDVLALSEDGVSRWSGSAWTHGAAIPYTVHATARGPSHLYLVATPNGTTTPQLVRFDGTSYQNVIAVDRAYTELTVVRDDDIWAYAPISGGGVGHYDGATFEADPYWSSSFSGPYGLHGSAPNNVWAVSTDGEMYRFDGSAWTEEFHHYGADWLDAVVTFGPDDVWTAGSGGLLQHWDGTYFDCRRNPTWKWTVAMHGNGPDDIFLMAGYSGETESVAHYDGHEWREHATGAGVSLRDLAGDETMMWLAGANTSLLFRPGCMAGEPCACTGESEAELCTALGFACGSWSTVDRCGRERWVDCGGCTSGTCGARGTHGVCEAPPTPALRCTSEDLTRFTAASGVIGVGRLASYVPLCAGEVLVADRDASAVLRIDALDGAERARYALSGPPEAMHLDERSGHLFVSLAPSATLVRIDLASGAQTSIALAGPPIEIAAGEPGEIFVSLDTGEYYRRRPIAVIDVDSATVLTTITGSGDGTGPGFEGHIAYDRTRRLLVSGSSEVNPGQLASYRYDALNRRFLEHEIAEGVGSGVCEMTMSNDGQHLAYACGGGNSLGYTIVDFDPAHLFDAINARGAREMFDVGGYPGSVDFSADSSRLLTEDGALTVYDTTTRAEIATYSVSSLSGGWSTDYRTARWSLGEGLVFLHVNVALDTRPNRLVWVRTE
jgi:hypothetical protein